MLQHTISSLTVATLRFDALRASASIALTAPRGCAEKKRGGKHVQEEAIAPYS